jgi:hypothetical protein
MQSWGQQGEGSCASRQAHCGQRIQFSHSEAFIHPLRCHHKERFAQSSLPQHRRLHNTPHTPALPHHEVLDMPMLSPTMKVGTLVQWHFKEGDAIAAGDSMATVETDKSVMSTFPQALISPLYSLFTPLLAGLLQTPSLISSIIAL